MRVVTLETTRTRKDDFDISGGAWPDPFWAPDEVDVDDAMLSVVVVAGFLLSAARSCSPSRLFSLTMKCKGVEE